MFGAFALSDLAEVYAIQGKLNLAADTFRQAIALPADQDVWPFPPTCAAYIGLGALLYEQNALEEATQYLEKGIELSEQGGYRGYMRRGYLTLARLKQTQGQSDAVADFLNKAETFVLNSQTPWIKMQHAATQAWLWLMQGQLDAAAAWADSYNATITDVPMPIYQRHCEQVLIAEIRLAQDRSNIAALENLCEAARINEWQSSLIHILILQALVYGMAGKTQIALTALEEALNLAEAEGHTRIFLDKGPLMAKLLRSVLSRQVSTRFVGTLQASFMPSIEGQTRKSQPLIEPLTKRELEVMRYIAAGMSNREIAEEMIVAMGTVAKYTNNIFTKLHVRNRTQAVTEAKALELI